MGCVCCVVTPEGERGRGRGGGREREADLDDVDSWEEILDLLDDLELGLVVEHKQLDVVV